MDLSHLNTADLVEKQDGWFNILAGSGIRGSDKKMSTGFTMGDRLDDAILSDLFRADGLAKRIINIPVSDMVREWFYIENDTDNKIIKYLKKKKARSAIKSALKWADLFGGAVVFMGINDGNDGDKPVDIKKIKDIKFFEVYDKRSITWGPDDLYNDAKEAKYGRPQIYTITNPTTGNTFRIHDSRILRFDGEECPVIEKARNQGWNDSKLQAVFDRLQGFGDSLGGVEAINTEFIMGVMKVSNLQQLLGSKDGEQALQNRIKAMDLVKHILNTIVIDKTEEFERVTSIGVSGLRDLIDVLIDVICGITGIPRVKLIGDQSKGLGGGAEGNIRLYYDEISARQEDELEDQLNILCEYTANIVGFKDPISIKFNKLWQPSEKEEAETKLINAKTDGVYMDSGLPPEYVFKSRFGGQSYGKDLQLPEEYIKKIESMSVEELVNKVEEGDIRQTNMAKNPNEDENE